MEVETFHLSLTFKLSGLSIKAAKNNFFKKEFHCILQVFETSPKLIVCHTTETNSS